MLFDTSSPGRKRVLRVVYGGLALLFLVGFVGFGVGGNASGGGILDALGITDSGSGSTSSQYSTQIDAAEKKLEAKPKDARALASLARYRYLSGQTQLDVDQQTGQPSVTEDSRAEFESSVAAWTRYLQTKPAKPDPGVAGLMAQAYRFLNDAAGAAKAQEIVAEANPSAGTYATLAFFRFADTDISGGDAAAAKASQEAGKGQRKQVDKQLASLRKAAVKQKQQLDQQAQQGGGAGQGLGDPFGGLGGGAGGAVPSPTP